MKTSCVVRLSHALIAAAALAGVSCAVSMGPVERGFARKSPRSLKQLTVTERQAVLKRAHVWEPIDTRSLNLLTGPPGPGAIEPNGTITCRFGRPDEPLGGRTSKFRCVTESGDVVKVKFGENNGEVFGVVAASRLLWALGFAVPRWYPARVKCLDCPEDPWKASSLEWHKGWPRFVAPRTYELAAVERDFAGDEVETPGYEGWSWPELAKIDPERGSPRAHVDGLKLAAVFLQHNDTKPVQQKIVCPAGQLRVDREGNETCETARLVLADVGATFSQGTYWSVGKVGLEKWRQSPIWRDPGRCEGQLDRYLNGSLEHPVISEAGRRWLAERLSLLGDRQLRDLFTAARIDRHVDQVKTDSGSRRATVDDWVRVFKDKRAQIVNHRCA